VSEDQAELTSEEDDSYQLDDLTVTATKRKSRLMETPVAVTAISKEMMDREGVRNILDIGSLVPSTQIGFSPSDSGVQVTVRGITSNNFTELGDPTVGIHVDGIYSPRPQGGLALLHDVERIEVLRGPQGTLFGRNSTAGAINIITARPDFDRFTGFVDAEVGKYNLRASHGVVNIPVAETFALRASYVFEQRDGYIRQEMDTYDFSFDTDGDGTTTGIYDVGGDGIPNTDQRRNEELDASDYYTNVDRWAARMTARWSPSYRFDWQIALEHFQDRSAGGLSLKDCEKAEGTFFECDHETFYASINVPGKLDFTIDTIRSEMKFDVTERVLGEFRVAYSSQQRFQQWDADAGAFADPDHPAYGFGRQIGDQDFGPLVNDPQAIIDAGFEVYTLLPWEDIQLTTRDSKYDSLVAELQFKSSDYERLQWVAGAFFMEEKNSIRFDVDIPFCCGVVRPLGQTFLQPDRRVESQALFAQFDYALSSKLNLTFGYRHTWDKKSDTGGSNHETIGYWVNPALWDPNNTFWHESYALVGIEPNWGQDLCDGTACFYQADDLTDEMGSLAADFPERIPGTDNSYEAEWDKGTWRIGLDYDLNENWFFYTYVATGFKAGGFGDKIDVCECGEITSFPYDPEEVTTWEAGFKTSLNDGKLKFLGTVFWNDYDDMQRTMWAIVGESVNSGRDIGTLLTTNIAEAEIKGIELEFDWLPYRNGRLFGWLTWLDAEITKLPGADDGWFCFERAYLGLTPCPAEDPDQPRGDGSLRRPTDYSGNQLPWSPEWSGTLTFEHNWYPGAGLRLSPYVSAHWQSEMFFSDGNFDEGPCHSGQKAFTTVNAALRLINERAKWAVEAYVYNATDELVRSWADGGPGYLRANFFAPRIYGIKFRKDW
jgi:iron complex outermembrane receptor protein